MVVYRDGVPCTGEYSVDPGTDVFSLGEVEGSGTVIFELVVDGVPYDTLRVEF